MSKKSRTKAKDKRNKEKAARKAAMRARYERWRDEGKNNKSFRARKAAAARKGMRSRTHPHGMCGNPGCEKCYGIHFKGFLVKGEPRNMPQRMWLKWQKLTKEERKAASK